MLRKKELKFNKYKRWNLFCLIFFFIVAKFYKNIFFLVLITVNNSKGSFSLKQIKRVNLQIFLFIVSVRKINISNMIFAIFGRSDMLKLFRLKRQESSVFFLIWNSTSLQLIYTRETFSLYCEYLKQLLALKISGWLRELCIILLFYALVNISSVFSVTSDCSYYWMIIYLVLHE